MESDGSGLYTVTAPTETSDRVCQNYTICDSGTEYISTEASSTSDRQCTNLSICSQDEEEAKAATSTSDRECVRSNAADASKTENEASVSSSMVGAVIVAGILTVVLLALFVKYQRDKPKRDSTDLDRLVSGTSISPMSTLGKSDSGDANIYPIAGVLVPGMHGNSEDPAVGDRLWSDFRRGIAFDHVYFGNQLMQLGDAALEDVYAILDMKCPPRSFFGHLRSVGDRFLHKDMSLRDSSLDDVVDFLCRTMPDVMVERAIDMCALKKDMRDSEFDEAIYDLIDDFVPSQNPYLQYDGIGFGLQKDAAFRDLNRVDPIYFEAEDEADNGASSEYAFARAIEGDPVYGVALSGLGARKHTDWGGDTSYDTASGVGISNPNFHQEIYDNQVGSTEPTYAVGDSNTETTYALGNNDGDNEGDYGCASASEMPNTRHSLENEYSLGSTPVDNTYTLGHADTTLEEPLYGVANAVISPEGIYDNTSPPSNGVDEMIYDNGCQNKSNTLRRATEEETTYGITSDVITPLDTINRETVYDNGVQRESLYGIKDLIPDRTNSGYVVAETYAIDDTYSNVVEDEAIYGNHTMPVSNTVSDTYALPQKGPRSTDSPDTVRRSSIGFIEDGASISTRSNSYEAAVLLSTDNDAQASDERKVEKINLGSSCTSLDIANLEANFLEMDKAQGIDGDLEEDIDIDSDLPAGYLHFTPNPSK